MASGQAVALWNVYRTLDCQPAGVNVKAGAGEVGGWCLSNNTGSVRYVKLYDKATTPTQADTPKMTLMLPANCLANVLAPAGVDFINGIGVRCSTGVADNDTGAPTANDVVVNLLWR